MTPDYPTISRTDTAKILALVQEYAEKLRALCVAYSDAKAKRQQIALMSATSFSIITAAILFIGKVYFPIKDLNDSLLPFFAVIFLCGTLIVPLIWIGPLARSRDLYDVHQVALTVERLIRTASQYGEHSTRALGDKFEFDIRLAEAEAALHVYRNVFRENGKQSGNFG
jgi:hypothetical protein